MPKVIARISLVSFENFVHPVFRSFLWPWKCVIYLKWCVGYSGVPNKPAARLLILGIFFLIWYAMFWFDTQTKKKYILKTFRDEESLPDQKQSRVSWKIGLKSAVCFLILFVLMDAILLSLTLQKRTMYKIFFFTFNTFV